MAKKVVVKECKYIVAFEKNEYENKTIEISTYQVSDTSKDKDVGISTMHNEISTLKIKPREDFNLKSAVTTVNDITYAILITRINERKDNKSIPIDIFDKEKVNFQNLYSAINEVHRSFDSTELIATIDNREQYKNKCKVEFNVDTNKLDEIIDTFVAMENL